MREQYERLRSVVIANARAKLAARNLRFPEIDLEAWYNAAWHGLHRAVVDGAKEIENPGGWLVVAIERRAIDEVRRTRRDRLADLPEDSSLAEGVVEPDFAAQLDDLDRIRRWRSAIRLRLSRRERQAAVLHFILGFSRGETAERLGVPPRRADKIFDSITRKTAGLLEAIDDGSWCDSERSLMVAFSAGLLDPDGERYAVALQHVSECPGCAAFVRSTRNAFLIVPAPAVAGVATVAGGGALGALSLAETTSGGAGAGVTAGGAGLFGGLTAKTAVMCASAVCLTGAGAGVAVVESVRHPTKPSPARAARSPTRASTPAAPNPAIGPRPIVATTPRSAAPSLTPRGTADVPRPAPRAAPKQNSRPKPRSDAQSRTAATQRQQEDELGIEPGGSAPSIAPPASSGSGPTSGASASAPTASGTSAGGATSSSAPSKTSAPASGSPPSESRSQPEIGIEP